MPGLVFYFLLIELLGVSYIDFFFGKIHNIWPILNILLYALLIFIFPDYYVFNLKTFVFPLAFIFVWYILYLMNIMGAGDSKYLFSFFLLVPTPKQEEVFICLAYTTIFVGVFLLASTIVLNFKKILYALRLRDIGSIKKIFGSKFTYAPVILISWIWFGWINSLFTP